MADQFRWDGRPLSLADLDSVADKLRAEQVQPGTTRFNFTINAVIIRYFLGDDWFSEHAQPDSEVDSYIKPNFKTDRSDEVEPDYSVKTLNLAEMLFNLQHIGGFAKRLEHMRFAQLESGIAELQVAQVLKMRGIPFRFVIDGEKTTVDIVFDGPDRNEALCEVKCKLETTPFTPKTLRNAIGAARSQIGKGNVGILFVKIPISWVEIKQDSAQFEPDIRLPRSIIETSKNELRQTSRIKKLIFYVFQYAFDGKSGFGITHTTMEFDNPRNRAPWKGDLFTSYPGGTWYSMPELAKRWV